MKRVLFVGVLISAPFGAAYASGPDYSEVNVISVVPRSPDVKPIVMSLPAAGRQKHSAQNEIGERQRIPVRNEFAADAIMEKAFSSTNGAKILQKAPRQ